MKDTFAIGMAVLLLAINSLVFASVAEHSVHHAHHTSSTHATALCSWICTAGEVHGDLSIVVDRPTFVIESIAEFSSSLPRLPVWIALVSRAPPHSAVSIAQRPSTGV